MDDGNATIADTSVTDYIAYLMEVDSARVQKVMTTKVMETQRGGRRDLFYDVPLNPFKLVPDAMHLSKAIYNNLFEGFLSYQRLNEAACSVSQVIGILVPHPFFLPSQTLLKYMS